MDNLFFSRCATWSQLDDQIVAHDSFSPLAPRMITMDPWPQLVFLAADGEHTVGDFVGHLGSQYEGGVPAGLREQVIDLVRNLVDEGLVRLHDQPQPLPPIFAEEYHSKSPAERKRQMVEYGFLKADEAT